MLHYFGQSEAAVEIKASNTRTNTLSSVEITMSPNLEEKTSIRLGTQYMYTGNVQFFFVISRISFNIFENLSMKFLLHRNLQVFKELGYDNF